MVLEISTQKVCITNLPGGFGRTDGRASLVRIFLLQILDNEPNRVVRLLDQEGLNNLDEECVDVLAVQVVLKLSLDVGSSWITHGSKLELGGGGGMLVYFKSVIFHCVKLQSDGESWGRVTLLLDWVPCS